MVTRAFLVGNSEIIPLGAIVKNLILWDNGQSNMVRIVTLCEIHISMTLP